MQKDDNCILRNINDQVPYDALLKNSCYVPVLNKNLCCKWNRKKGKGRTHIYFSFQTLLTQEYSKDKVLVEYAPIKKEKGKVEMICTVFPLFWKNKIHKHVPVMKYILYNFYDSSYDLMVLIFAIRAAFAQYKDEW